MFTDNSGSAPLGNTGTAQRGDVKTPCSGTFPQPLGHSTSILLKSVEAFNTCEKRHPTSLCQMFLDCIQQAGSPKSGTAQRERE